MASQQTGKETDHRPDVPCALYLKLLLGIEIGKEEQEVSPAGERAEAPVVEELDHKTKKSKKSHAMGRYKTRIILLFTSGPMLKETK